VRHVTEVASAAAADGPARPGDHRRADAGDQPAGIHAAALRYLTTVPATLRPNTVGLRADSLIVFAVYLAAAHPQVRSLTQLTCEHVEDSWPTTTSGPGAGASPATRRYHRQ
jgi:hypothetical protein